MGTLFENRDYVEWRRQRLDALLQHDPTLFAGRRVLELGGGDGHMTLDLSALGAEVTLVEAREDYVQLARARIPGPVVKHDLELDLPQEVLDGAPYDLVFHVGLLYHLGDPVRSIREATSVADVLVLETEVVDSSDPDARLEKREDAGKADDGVGPVGVRLSHAGVERALRECGFEPEVVRVSDRDGSPHRYGWDERDDGTCRFESSRRMWLARRA